LDVKLDALILKNRALASEATAFAYKNKQKQSNGKIINELQALFCRCQAVRIVEYREQALEDR